MPTNNATYYYLKQSQHPYGNTVVFRDKKTVHQGHKRQVKFAIIMLTSTEHYQLVINGETYRLSEHHLSFYHTYLANAYNSNTHYTAELRSHQNPHLIYKLHVYFDENNKAIKDAVTLQETSSQREIHLDHNQKLALQKVALMYSLPLFHLIRAGHKRYIEQQHQQLKKSYEDLFSIPQDSCDSLQQCLDHAKKVIHLSTELALIGIKDENLPILKQFQHRVDWELADRALAETATKTVTIDLHPDSTIATSEIEVMQSTPPEAQAEPESSSMKDSQTTKSTITKTKKITAAFDQAILVLKSQQVSIQENGIAVSSRDVLTYNELARKALGELLSAEDAGITFDLEKIKYVYYTLNESQALCTERLKKSLEENDLASFNDLKPYIPFLGDDSLISLVQRGRSEELAIVLQTSSLEIELIGWRNEEGKLLNLLELCYQQGPSGLPCFKLLLAHDFPDDICLEDGNAPLAIKIFRHRVSNPFYVPLLQSYWDRRAKPSVFINRLIKFLQTKTSYADLQDDITLLEDILRDSRCFWNKEAPTVNEAINYHVVGSTRAALSSFVDIDSLAKNPVFKEIAARMNQLIIRSNKINARQKKTIPASPVKTQEIFDDAAQFIEKRLSIYHPYLSADQFHEAFLEDMENQIRILSLAIDLAENKSNKKLAAEIQREIASLNATNPFERLIMSTAPKTIVRDDGTRLVVNDSRLAAAEGFDTFCNMFDEFSSNPGQQSKANLTMAGYRLFGIKGLTGSERRRLKAEAETEDEDDSVTMTGSPRPCRR